MRQVPIIPVTVPWSSGIARSEHMQRGVHAILYAYFDADERLDRAAMRLQVDLCLQARVAGIAALGLATEVAKLAFDERCTLMDWAAKDVAGRVPLGFTIYGQSVAEQIAGVRHAERVGADWLILQPPATGSYAASEYLDFFGRVMRATTLPTAIQNAPQYLGRGLSDEDIQTLRAANPNFTVIKSEATAAECAKLVQMAGPEFRVFNGRGGQEMVACLDAGCTGFLLAPDLVDYGVRVMALHDAGDRAAAEALHGQCLPAIGFVMRSIEHLICYGKRLFALRAGLETFDRAPALRPDPSGIDTVRKLALAAGRFPTH
jgi:4-hydroxy-tetrahydrodipicolinate synthase